MSALFGEAVFDLNAAAAVTIDPTTRYIQPGVGSVMQDNPFGNPAVKANEITSPWFVAGDALLTVGGTSVDLQTVTTSFVNGSATWTGVALEWVRSDPAGTMTLNIPVTVPQGERFALSFEGTMGMEHVGSEITFRDAGGVAVGAAVYSTSNSFDPFLPRGYVFAAVPTGAGVVSVDVLLKMAAGTQSMASTLLHSMSYAVGADVNAWTPGLDPATSLIAPVASAHAGALRFEGPGKFAVTSYIDPNWQLSISSAAGVKFSTAWDADGELTYYNSLSNLDGQYPDFFENGFTPNWVFGDLLAGEWVEVIPVRQGGLPGWEWEGVENASRSLANVVRNGEVQFGADMGLSSRPGLTYYLDFSQYNLTSEYKSLFWAMGELSIQEDGTKVFNGGELIPEEPMVLVDTDGLGATFDVYTVNGKVNTAPINYGPPGFIVFENVGVRRAAAWSRVLSPAEIATLFVASSDKTVSWSAPADGGSAVLGYRIFKVVGGAYTMEEVGSDVFTHTAVGYSGPIVVAAVNAVGQGTPGVA